MKKEHFCYLILTLFSSGLIAQTDNENKQIKISFDKIQKENFTDLYYQERKQLDYDFKIIDSLYFEKHYLKQNLYNVEFSEKNYKEKFEIKISKTKSVVFYCDEEIKEKCIEYLGYLQNLGAYVLSKCDEICETYLLNSSDGSVIVLPGEFDSGVSVSSTGKYLIIWASNDHFKEYYNLRTHIDVFKIKKYSNGDKFHDLFEYIGSIESKNWSISNLESTYSEDDFFVMKIYDTDKKFNYFEIQIK